MEETEIESVPLGDVMAVFNQHGLPSDEATALLTFLVGVWVVNEPDMQYDLTKDCIELSVTDELLRSALIIEVLPKLLDIATLVHTTQQGRTLASHNVQPYTIILEFFK